MSNFKVKLLGLAGMATLFSGLSYGQVACTAAQTVTATNSGFLLRVEGETELVSNATLTCPASNPTNGVTVTVSASAAITSKAIAPVNTPGGNGNSEVVLIITNNGVAPATSVLYGGTVTGSLVTFTNVNFPGNFSATLTNVRVNASTGAVGTSVLESWIIGQNGIAQFAQNQIAVGQILRGLQTPALLPVNTTPPTLTPTTVPVCTGDVISNFAAPPAAFTVNVQEGFPGAFKLQNDLTNQANSESGITVQSAVTGIGLASASTQITITFANLPATAQLYVPLTASYVVSAGPPAVVATLTLANTQTPAVSPGGLALINPTQGAYTYGDWRGCRAAAGTHERFGHGNLQRFDEQRELLRSIFDSGLHADPGINGSYTARSSDRDHGSGSARSGWCAARERAGKYNPAFRSDDQCGAQCSANHRLQHDASLPVCHKCVRV